MCHSYYKLAGGSVSTESLNEYLFFVVAISFTVFTELWSIGSTPVSFPFRIVFRPVKTPALFAMMPKRPKFPTTWLQKLGHLLSNPRPHERSWPCHLADCQCIRVEVDFFVVGTRFCIWA